MFHNDPSRMSEAERLDEVAALLAAGFLRLKRRTGRPKVVQKAVQHTVALGRTTLHFGEGGCRPKRAVRDAFRTAQVNTALLQRLVSRYHRRKRHP